MNVIIYRKGTAVVTVKITDNSYVNHNLMGDETAYIEFFATSPVALQMGDYCTLLNHTYFVRDAVIPVRDGMRLKYQLTLYGTQYELEKAKYFILDSTGFDQTAKTTWNCTPLQLLQQMVVNLKRVQPTVDWGVGECISANAKDVELADNNCLEILQNAAEAWECDYYVNEYLISLKKIVPGEYPLNLEVGFNKGLRQITVNKSGDSSVITRLYAYGAETNMPSGQVLSIPVINDSEAVEVVEGIKHFDIFPEVSAIITDIVHMTGESIKTAPLGFQIGDYLIPGTNPRMTFKSGQLKGLEFDFNWHYDNTFEVIPYTSNGVTIPGASGYNYAIGDEFVIWNITMPPAYVNAAKAELQEAAEAYLAQVSRQKLKLNITTDDIYFARNTNKYLYPGQTLNIKTSIVPFLASGVAVNVIGFKNYITQPHRYESVIVGDVYYSRPFGTVIQVNRNEQIFKNTIAGGDKYYRHTQVLASAEWIVNHDMGKHPAVTITDDSGKQIDAVITYTSNTSLTVNFSAARTGYAECN